MSPLAIAVFLIPFLAFVQKPALPRRPAQGEKVALVGGSFGEVLGQECFFRRCGISGFQRPNFP